LFPANLLFNRIGGNEHRLAGTRIGIGSVILANQYDNIEAEIVDVLKALVPEGTVISPKAGIARDLGLDSVAVMDFVMDIEDHFDISIPLDRIAEVESVEDLSRAVEALLKEKA
jgi:acyl carrier protein